jgi:hypothetical protein
MTQITDTTGATAEIAERQQTEEEKAAGYLEGRALIILCLAFMSVSFVLALDKTILGLDPPALCLPAPCIETEGIS